MCPQSYYRSVGNRAKNRRQKDSIKTASDYGVDVSMLIENVKRTPAELIRRHQAALNTVQKLRKR